MWPLSIALALILGLASCGSDGASVVEAGQSGPDPSGPVEPSPSEPTVPGSASTPAPTPGPAPTTGSAPTTGPTTPVAVPGPAGPSPVEGLDADQLRRVVNAAPSARARGAGGPTAEPVVLADGRKVWRVRIPGDFPARAARGMVLVDGREVGPASSSPSLDALVAVALSADGLIDGAAVTYRWEGAEPVSAGPLTVLR